MNVKIKPAVFLLVSVWLIFMVLCGLMHAQTPTQVKQVLPNTPSIVFNWDYNVTDEPNIDSFVLQRSTFAVTTTITTPYDQQIVITQKTIRSATFTMPTGLTAGQKAFFRLVARKTGLADSAPSNVVEVDVMATPPAPVNFRFP